MISNNLNFYLKIKNMTQKDLATKIQVTDKAVSKWERGLGFPDINTIEYLADALNVSIIELMKSERGIIEEKEQVYGDSVILIYHGYCYVFTENNGLKTVYKNDRVRM